MAKKDRPTFDDKTRAAVIAHHTEMLGVKPMDGMPGTYIGRYTPPTEAELAEATRISGAFDTDPGRVEVGPVEGVLESPVFESPQYETPLPPRFDRPTPGPQPPVTHEPAPHEPTPREPIPHEPIAHEPVSDNPFLRHPIQPISSYQPTPPIQDPNDPTTQYLPPINHAPWFEVIDEEGQANGDAKEEEDGEATRRWVRIERTLPGEPGSAERERAVREDERIDSQIESRGIPPRTTTCTPTCSILEKFWNNHPTQADGRLTNEFNRDENKTGRTSWHVDWPGFPEWHVKAEIKASHRAWIYWQCHINFVGSRLNDDKSLATTPRLRILDHLDHHQAYRDAWHDWLKQLVGEETEDGEIENRLRRNWQPPRTRQAWDERVGELSPARVAGFGGPGGGVRLKIDGYIPCRSGVYEFVFPVPPAPASLVNGTEPTVHNTFYVCEFAIRAEGKCEATSGDKMRVVDHDDT
jgi:hypothetical protein